MTATTLPKPCEDPIVSLLSDDARQTTAASGQSETVARLLEAGLYAPLQAFLARPGKAFRAQLCERSFAMLGGTNDSGLPAELPLAIEALHAGSLIVDDVQDSSCVRRGGPALHRTVGLDVALNAGNWLYFWPQRLLERAAITEVARSEARARMGRCLLRCHEGQALDLTVKASRIERLDQHEVAIATSERKTGALMGLAAAFGGIAAGGDRASIDVLDRFGTQLGVGLQMLDDLSGVLNADRAKKGLEDLWNDRLTWAWALVADGTDTQGFCDLRARHAELLEKGKGAESDMKDLLGELRFRLAVTGPRRARSHMDACVAEVSAHVTPGQALQSLVTDLRRLERGFLEVKR